MPYVCVLQSQSTKKFYIGCTAQMSGRLAEHQRGQTASTRGRGPWELAHKEEFGTLSEARCRERQLKAWKSHRSIQELIDAQVRT
jgi:putative endonuclease